MDLHKFDQPIPAITTPYSYTPESNYAKDLERWILINTFFLSFLHIQSPKNGLNGCIYLAKKHSWTDTQ